MPKKDQQGETSILVDTAKAIGAAAGKLAAKAGIGAPEAPPAQTRKPKPGKLEKKQRSRLPRLQKKAMKKTRDTRGEADLERLVS